VSTSAAEVEALLRALAPQVLGALVRHHGGFDACEDAVQEALLAAAVQWPTEGVPSNPKGWLIRTASRRRIELWRNESARRRREETAATLDPTDPQLVSDVDDTLNLLLLCCHPALTSMSQVALTLRAVGGLSTAEIARAFLVPESTVAQRISRAKQHIKASGAEFCMPTPAERPERLAAVLRVLYLIFNEGYTASSGSALQRVELTSEAIRLTRQLHARLADDGEVAGLLALMLLTDARRPARARPDGALVPLAEQDRELWDARAIAEGIDLITRTLASAPIGPYQLQAAIAAVHDEAPRADDTDWPQILGLYELLDSLAPGPMVTLGRIVAVAMVHGPAAGLRQLAEAEREPALGGHHRVHAVRAHLLEMTGDRQAARAQYELAARRTLSVPEQRYLEARAARLALSQRLTGPANRG
jgi:RNA polymerase sigma factor (sigma-70 family)